MKVTIDTDGFLWVIAENGLESYALKQWWNTPEQARGMQMDWTSYAEAKPESGE